MESHDGLRARGRATQGDEMRWAYSVGNCGLFHFLIGVLAAAVPRVFKVWYAAKHYDWEVLCTLSPFFEP